MKEDAITKAMTDGQWAITSFYEDQTDLTSSFSGYKFQYYNDRTVDAIKNSVVEKKGSWGGDAATMTTWADFAGATAPLDLINGSWQIDNSGWTFVEATQILPGGHLKMMRLDKQ